ncbi:RrF2 family transcriptional regulator [Cryobacterium psychrophilum]|uniref:Rrf2 family transcriptional regulator n=1 Tax=Cryobacterium psychrophilum TaxID=41988 RepID=A0A4Y8KPI6_9MICO|nr:Rrf2 family transcriptional regulator [Cryobacterium psychrophilum]TDW31058.1 BadM/Rrf2 family transcriptional regulator [Cryobacterium psychrophilum]TFD78642.1 Rrf2 family transcriptional regulator [Cryobacterium psychrophilum]
MRINAFSDVCLRVVMLLAAEPTPALLTSRTISEGIDTPYNHVTKAISRLRELDVVDVVRGRAGGVQISTFGRRATVGWLLRQLDTRLDLAGCETHAGTCPLIAGCGLRGALRRAREAFYGELDGLVIADMLHSRTSGPVPVTLLTRPSGT